MACLYVISDHDDTSGTLLFAQESPFTRNTARKFFYFKDDKLRQCMAAHTLPSYWMYLKLSGDVCRPSGGPETVWSESSTCCEQRENREQRGLTIYWSNIQNIGCRMRKMGERSDEIEMMRIMRLEMGSQLTLHDVMM